MTYYGSEGGAPDQIIIDAANTVHTFETRGPEFWHDLHGLSDGDVLHLNFWGDTEYAEAPLTLGLDAETLTEALADAFEFLAAGEAGQFQWGDDVVLLARTDEAWGGELGSSETDYLAVLLNDVTLDDLSYDIVEYETQFGSWEEPVMASQLQVQVEIA